MYYISTGETSSMYTLRSQTKEMITNSVGVRFEANIDVYIRNLSTDSKKAVETAKALGYEVSQPEFTLAEIKRINSENARILIENRIAEERASFIAKEYEQIRIISDGYWPFGKYKGNSIGRSKIECKIIDDPNYISYCKYWLTLDGSDNVINALQKVINSLFPIVAELLKIEKGNDKYFGEHKEKFKNVSATVVSYFGFDGMYGWTDVVGYALDSGELCVYMGGSGQDVSVGQKVSINFSVKSFEDYKGTKQTKIIRIKIV